MLPLREITIEETNNLIHQSGAVVLDIRDADSYQEAHIKNALNLDRSTVGDFIASTDKTKPVICYCYHGHSSQQAALFLMEKGFTEVYSMIGGFEAWRQAYPVEIN